MLPRLRAVCDLLMPTVRESAGRHEYDGEVRGRGLIYGIEFPDASTAGRISKAAFKKGLIIETAGPRDGVLKALPPLTISDDALARGLEIVEHAARIVHRARRREPVMA